MKRKDKVNRLVCKTQTRRGDKSHANTEIDAVSVRLRGPYAGTVLTVNARGAVLSGDLLISDLSTLSGSNGLRDCGP
jgi:hypothetical protein